MKKRLTRCGTLNGKEAIKIGSTLYVGEQNSSLFVALSKLAHYEDLAEQKRLVELPCAVGDTAWHICGGEIEKDVISGIEYMVDGFCLYSDDIWLGKLNDIVFLTREEANAKLAEKGSVENG